MKTRNRPVTDTASQDRGRTSNSGGTSPQSKRFDRLRRRRKMLLAYHGITQAQIAADLGKSQWTVATVVNRYPEKKSLRIQEYIAERLGVAYERLWGAHPRSGHKGSLTDIKKAVNDY